MLEQDVHAELAARLAGVEERGASLRVAGGHIGAVLGMRGCGKERVRDPGRPEPPSAVLGCR